MPLPSEDEHQRATREQRRAETVNNTPSQSLESLLKLLPLTQPTPVGKESKKVRKAYCPRLANRQTVIGNTVFTFDNKGICTFKNTYRATCIEDFEQLLKMNGVVELDKDGKLPTQTPVSVPPTHQNVEPAKVQELLQSSLPKLTNDVEKIEQPEINLPYRVDPESTEGQRKIARKNKKSLLNTTKKTNLVEDIQADIALSTKITGE
jgi:hypothetical protein